MSALKDLGLKRYPVRSREQLQAWDSADELLLAERRNWKPGSRIVVACDQFGALSRSLIDEFELTAYTDSYLSFRAIGENTGGKLQPVSLLTELRGSFDLALVRVPKSLSYFEDLLCHLSRTLPKGTQVVCGFMVKHQSRGSLELLERLIGPTTTSLAKKKARISISKLDKSGTPSSFPRELLIEGFRKPFCQFSNLFSREKLDIGTRFFLDNLGELPADAPSVLDLGCGNGILGIRAKLLRPRAGLLFSDESRQAIESSRMNFSRTFPGEEAQFHWTHACEEIASASVDLILCNPPFHQGHAVGEAVAHEMFREAHRVLRPGGCLRVVANSHLRYLGPLRKQFQSVRTLATSRKFLVYEARR